MSDVTARVCGGDGSSPMGVWSGEAPNCTGKSNVIFRLYVFCLCKLAALWFLFMLSW